MSLEGANTRRNRGSAAQSHREMSEPPITVDAMAEEPWEIRTSTRRTRTMSAFREAGRIVVVIPARMTMAQRSTLVPPLVERFLAKERRRAAPRGDAEVTQRARKLYEMHLAPVVDGPIPEFGVRWVSTMRSRWGSCTPATGEIRISDRLQGFPSWVVDYVLMHELTHLVEPTHNDRFWRLALRLPDAERAKGFLEGVDFDRSRADG